MRRIYLLPVGLYRLDHLWGYRYFPRAGLLRLEYDLDPAVFVRLGLRDLGVRHAHDILDTAGTPVQ